MSWVSGAASVAAVEEVAPKVTRPREIDASRRSAQPWPASRSAGTVGAGRAGGSTPAPPQRSKPFASLPKFDAERHLIQVQHDLLTGGYVDPARSRTTVADFYRTLSARQPWHPSTRESVRTRFDNHVLPVLGARPLGLLRRGDIEAWLAGRRLAPSTAGIALQQLSSMLEAAVADGLIARNPARGVRRPKVAGSLVVPFTPEEIDRLVEATPPSFAVAIVLGARCGLRHGEAAGLTLDRVDFLRRELTVDRQLVTGRSGGLPVSFGPLETANCYRTVSLADSTVTALAARLEARGTGVDGLPVHDDGRAVNAARFGYLVAPGPPARRGVAHRPLPRHPPHLRLGAAVGGRLRRRCGGVPR